DAAAQLADGVLDEPVPLSGRDELADLGEAFNAMREKVVAREEALRAAHDRLEEGVSERTHELNAMNSRLVLVSMAAERSPVSLMITDAQGVILYVNRALA